MSEAFSRTERLLGRAAMEKLGRSTVAVFGIGGVGSYAVEALVRSGVGGLALFDDDRVCPSNLNRQIIATRETVGQSKVEAERARILSINPACRVEARACFYSEQSAGDCDLGRYDYIVDAIDTVPSKLTLIERAAAAGVPVISSMGAGNKLDPTRFEVADIYETSVCPLARVMRRELKKRGIAALKVVYSKEPPMSLQGDEPAEGREDGRAPGSVAFVPSVAGLILAGEVIRDIAGLQRPR